MKTWELLSEHLVNAWNFDEELVTNSEEILLTYERGFDSPRLKRRSE